MNTASRTSLAFMRHGETLFVLTTPTGHLRDMRVAGSFSPDWAAVDSASATIRRTCAAADISGTIDDAGMRAMRNAGQWLFDELLPFATKTLLRTGEGTLLLSLDPQLLDIPWELLHVDNQFLCERWGIGRSVQDDIHHENNATSAPPSTRVQIIADPDGSLNDAYAEGEALYQRLRRHPALEVSVRSGDVDLAYLRKHIRDGHVLHYAGHVDGNRLRLAGDPFEPAHLERLAGSGGLPRLVFLNGCAALRCTAWDSSLVRAWSHAGAAFLVGPTQPLPDRLGLLFAEAFYRELLQGAPVGAAIRNARAALTRQIGPAAAVWGAYVLYGDPAETLFEPAPRRQPRPEARRLETRLAGSPLRAAERPVIEAESTETALRLVRMPIDPWWLLAGLALALALLALGALR